MFLPIVALLWARQNAPPVIVVSLPQPLVVSKDVDAADYLAMKIAHHEPDAASALVSAMQGCGFTIIDRSKKVLFRPEKEANNGLAVEDQELIAALNATQDTPSISFKSLSEGLSVLEKGRSVADIHGRILDAWRAGMSHSNQGVRFLCHFLDDLSVHGVGTWSVNGSSISAGQIIPSKPNVLDQSPLASTGQVGMAASVSAVVQSAIMDVTKKLADSSTTTQERVMAAQQLEPLQKLQMTTLESTFGTGGTGQPPDQRQFGDKPLSVLQTLLITRRMYGDAFVAIPRQSDRVYASIAPEVGDDRDYTGTILDFGGATVGTLFNQAIVTEKDFGSLAKAADVANTIGAWGKMIATFSNLKITIDPDKVEVNRRKDTRPGDPKNLKLSVIVNFPPSDGGGKTGNLMLRTMSWGTGADIAAPDNGPVAGASVTWHLNEEAALFDHAAQWVSPGKAGDGQLKTVALTNNDGVVKIGIQGTPQKEPLPETSLSYDRKATITTEINLKGSNMYQDAIDAMNLVINANVGTGSGLLKTCLPDMLNRTSLLSTRSFPVTIHDWTPPLYEGKFTLELTGNAEKSSDGNMIKWSVSRRANGGVFSMMRGLSKADAMFKQGTGYYYFDIENLHNATISDSYEHKYMLGDCTDVPVPASDTFKSDGAVAQLNFPYALKGGSLVLKPESVKGKNQLTVHGKTTFSIPCRYRFISPTVKESGVQYMNLPIEFSDSLPSPATSLHGVGSQKIHTTIGGLEGDIQAKLTWELHPVK